MSRRMRVSAGHMVENLATGLYENSGGCLTELWRNGAVACMPGNIWEAGKEWVEIFLTDHPLAPKAKALIILDHGQGFTDPALDRFCFIGPSIADLTDTGYGTHGGAAQKRIGRFSGLALNKKCLEGSLRERIKHGFYLLTRTDSSGKIRLISMIPELMEKEDNLPERWITPDSTEMGCLKGIKGSFTAIVIPNPVFETDVEIREALQWLIPRKRSLLGKLLVGGKQLNPPKLPQAVTLEKDGIETYFALAPTLDRKTGGIWLCDAESGLRVARLPVLANMIEIAYPVWRHELTGDIFYPGLLAHQNTSRSGLNKEFANKRNPDWRKLSIFMLSQMAPRAKELMGTDDSFTPGTLTDTLKDIVSLLQETYGTPKKKVINSPEDTAKPADTEDSETTMDEPARKSAGAGTPRVYHIQLGGKRYALFTSQQLESTCFATIFPAEPERMYLNIRGYESMPKNKLEAHEHTLMRILETAAWDQHPRDTIAWQNFVGQRRRELITKLEALKKDASQAA